VRSGIGSGEGIGLVDHLPKLSVRSNDELELRLELAAQALEHELVGRIADCDHELAVLVEERKRDLAPSVLLVERLEGVRLRIGHAHVDEGEPLLAGEHAAKISLVEPAALEQHLAEALAGAHTFLERILELLLTEEPCPKDQRAERHVAHRRLRRLLKGRTLRRIGKRVRGFC
jgi:hypothetical protein